MKNFLLVFLALFYVSGKKSLHARSSIDTIKIVDGIDTLIYYPRMDYPKNNSFASRLVNTFNFGTSSQSFFKVIIYLVVSENVYIYLNEVPNSRNNKSEGFLSYNGYAKGGGVIRAGNSVEISYISHESFHALQDDKIGLKSNCINYELEAYMFQQLVCSELGGVYIEFADSTVDGQKFKEARNNLVYFGYSAEYYNIAETYFLYSIFNTNGLYDYLVECPEYRKKLPLIYEFLPK